MLVEYVEAMGYPSRATIFRGSERDVLVCTRRTKIVRNVMRNVGFPKLEHGIYALKKRRMTECLAYSNIKVRYPTFL